MTIERAYTAQTRIVRRALKGTSPAGFKAGLTSEAARARFRADRAIAGVLLREPQTTPNTLELGTLRGLHIETEVAMRIGKPIRRELRSIEELKAHIDGIAPAIELPNLDYEHPDQLLALDIIASNVAAAYFAIGSFLPPHQRDPNELIATLDCAGERVNVGNGRDALGDQWTAALWLANTMIEQGWELQPGQVLLTGALGKMIKAQPGDCTAQFGNWGSMTVHIVN